MGELEGNTAMPLVSVVMPAYNMEAYLAQSVESVLASDYKNIELLIIDDGSTDSTLAIAQQYEAKDSRVKALTKSNGGQGRARNYGVECATGKYLLLVDSDDLIGRSYISKAVAVMEQSDNVKVVTCRGEFFDGRIGAWKLKSYTPSTLARKNVFTISSMMRRDDYIRVGGFDANMHNYCEDWAFWIALLKDGGEVVKLDSVEFYYRVRRGSSRFTGRKYWHELIEVLNRKFPDFFERELGGKLYSQRSLSKWLNKAHRLFNPRKAIVAAPYDKMKYYLKALPRIAGKESEVTAMFDDMQVSITRCADAKTEYKHAVATADTGIIGYCVERRYLFYKRSWIVKRSDDLQ